MRAILQGPDDAHTPLTAAEFSIRVLGDELAMFVESGMELDDLPAFKSRLAQYRMAVERALVESFIEQAHRHR